MPRPNANSKLDEVRDLMGQKPDHEVAEIAGVSVSTVGKYRRRHNISAYQGYKFVKGKVGTPASAVQDGEAPKKSTKKSSKKAAKAAKPAKSSKKAGPGDPSSIASRTRNGLGDVATP